MLAYQHKGRTVNMPLDVSGLTGDAQVDSSSLYIQTLVGGRFVALTAQGVALADSASATPMQPLGFLVNDAAGYFFENKPALASGLVSVTRGPENVCITDQIDTTLTYAVGDLLYVGSGNKAGLVTNVKPTGANANPVCIGQASSTASVSAPQLTVLLFV